jgi:hypothetical protein
LVAISQHPYSRTENGSSVGRSTELWLQLGGDSRLWESGHRGNRSVVHSFVASFVPRVHQARCQVCTSRFGFLGVGMLHVRADRTVVRGFDMLEHIAKVGSTVPWVPSQRHARGGNAASGMVWGTAPHSADIDQGPRSLCHRLTYPLRTAG